MTYAEASAILSHKHHKGEYRWKKIGNNTVLSEHDENTIAVCLHNTNVVLIHADGTYTLNSGGWRTATTKDRINTYAPVRLYQQRREWYIGNGIEFFDGMVVNSAGVPVSLPEEVI